MNEIINRVAMVLIIPVTTFVWTNPEFKQTSGHFTQEMDKTYLKKIEKSILTDGDEVIRFFCLNLTLSFVALTVLSQFKGELADTQD